MSERTRRIAAGAASVLLIGTGAVAANRVAAAVTTPARSSGSLTRDQAATAYRALSAPVNSAESAFGGRTARWTDQTSASDMTADALSLSRALDDAHAELDQLAREYRPASGAFTAEIKTIAGVEADLARLVEVNVAITIDDWHQRFDPDLVALTDAANDVRVQLGLPRTGSTAVAAAVTL